MDLELVSTASKALAALYFLLVLIGVGKSGNKKSFNVFICFSAFLTSAAFGYITAMNFTTENMLLTGAFISSTLLAYKLAQKR